MEVCGPGGLRAPSRTSLSLSGSASRCPHAMVALWKGAMVGVQGAVMGVQGAVMVALWKADHPPDMMATLSRLQQREGTPFSGHRRRHHRRCPLPGRRPLVNRSPCCTPTCTESYALSRAL